MNRRPFNRSSFNRSNTATASATGLAALKMSAGPVFANRTISTLLSQSNLALSDSIAPTNVKFGSASAVLKATTLGDATQVLDAGAGEAPIILNAQANQSVQGESVISLEGLTLAPGDELIINTNEMTVILNGQNGMQYFSADSEFFALLSGLNTIIYSDGESERAINFNVIWKDRWL